MGIICVGSVAEDFSNQFSKIEEYDVLEDVHCQMEEPLYLQAVLRSKDLC